MEGEVRKEKIRIPSTWGRNFNDMVFGQILEGQAKVAISHLPGVSVILYDIWVGWRWFSPERALATPLKTDDIWPPRRLGGPLPWVSSIPSRGRDEKRKDEPNSGPPANRRVHWLLSVMPRRAGNRAKKISCFGGIPNVSVVGGVGAAMMNGASVSALRSPRAPSKLGSKARYLSFHRGKCSVQNRMEFPQDPPPPDPTERPCMSTLMVRPSSSGFPVSTLWKILLLYNWLPPLKISSVITWYFWISCDSYFAPHYHFWIVFPFSVGLSFGTCS